jgi:hypothetical protein
VSLRGGTAFNHGENATMADVQDNAERLGLVVITDGNRFEYARPGEARPGWRVFRMVQKSTPIDTKESQA